ncbi:hypothetical protein JTE90_006557 [Oedothorax gibbosus]|uniref:Ankyrin repeat protein n=1 Tax=Oedothorax gibbosus TaxID=931172 RepID=A0AAV6VIM6_9ARAC|nr:hypothetical protein JTE90_006557 [Oedothorax gibbosus]
MDKNISQHSGSNADVTFSLQEWRNFFDLMKQGEGMSFIEAQLSGEHDLGNIKFEDCTILDHASWYGDHHLVKYLIEKGDNSKIKIPPESTLLQLAAVFGYKEIRELLISSGVFIDASMSRAFSALHWAAGKRHVNIVKFLIEKGVALDEKDADDFTPLLIAAQQKRVSVVLMLINAGADIYYGTGLNTVLYCALRNGWLEVVKLLSSKGMDFNSEIPDCGIPVLIAAERGQKNIVLFLLEWGVNPYSPDPRKWSVLHFSADRKWADVASLVLKKGGDVNAKNHNGFTPLHAACFISEYDRRSPSERLELVSLLIASGANVNSKIISNNATPLDIAYKSPIREIYIIMSLLESGADCNIQDFTGLSLFDRFALSKDTEMILFSMHLSKVPFKGELNPIFTLYLDSEELCSSVLVYRFNHLHLPSLYKLRDIADGLPSIENMFISEEYEVLELKKSVNHEIQTKGYCNVFEFKPMLLRMLSVNALLSYYKEELKTQWKFF